MYPKLSTEICRSIYSVSGLPGGSVRKGCGDRSLAYQAYKRYAGSSIPGNRQLLPEFYESRVYSSGALIATIAQSWNELFLTAEPSAAVQALKSRLIHYTRFSLPDLSKPFVLRTDALGQAIWAVLGQEPLAIIRALEHWRQLLMTTGTTVLHGPSSIRILYKSKCGQTISWGNSMLAFFLIFVSGPIVVLDF